MVVSGYSVALIIKFVDYIINSFKKGRIIKAIICLLLILILCGLSQFQISILRASIVSAILLILKLFFKRKYEKYHFTFASIISIIIFITINPMIVFNLSFQFSYLAILGICLLYQRIYKTIFQLILSFELNCRKWLWGKYIKITNKSEELFKNITFISRDTQEFSLKIRRNYLKKKTDKIIVNLKIICLFFIKIIISAFCMTVSAQMFIIPIQIYLFNNYSFLSLIIGPIASLLDCVIKISGYIMLILIKVPIISNIFIYTTNFLSDILITLLKFSNTFKFLSIRLASPPFFLICSYYILLLLIIILFKVESIIKTKIYENKKYIETKRITIIIVTSIIVVLIIKITFSSYITIYNVSDGEFAHIKWKGKNIVIDCGSQDDFLIKSVVDSFVKSKNIKKIDLLIISHFHKDHVNGIEELMKLVKIEKIAYPVNIRGDIYWNKIQNLCDENNIIRLEMQEGDDFALNDLKFVVISPNKNTINKGDINNTNSMSLVFITNNKNIFFGADITKYTEENIIKNNILKKYNIDKINVLKVAHHGSNTSSSEEFIRNIGKIDLSIISSDKEKYNHPHDEILRRIEKYSKKVRQTYKEGSIKINI